VRHSLFGGNANGPVSLVTIPNSGYFGAFAAVVIVGYVVYFWRYQRIQA